MVDQVKILTVVYLAWTSNKNYLYCCLFVYLEFLKNLGYGEMKMLLQIFINCKHISSTLKTISSFLCFWFVNGIQCYLSKDG